MSVPREAPQSAQQFRLTQHRLRPLVTVAEANDYHLVAVGSGWFESAFEVAFGSSTEEVCRRFADDLKAVLVAHENQAAGVIGTEELVDLVQGIQFRLSVAAEWAERIAAMKDGEVQS
jgi:hypothetical protein